ncbi:hypothetical protein [Nocardiopsis sp. MG754419]|uniref:hypothetical protein n=1 Tax=Nocardiopsis sp. MG754419 TaxID=2259865 RepID=UPI001BACCB2F|nr:hypothetical protein [Nocardiopsis sp. MG754419]MBR8742282.1 hypothetical protein [Nocardiopsis sp. MG754419]
MSAIDRTAIGRLAALPLATVLLTSCGAEGGAVGAVATGHFSARHHFPVLRIAWCGESPPARIDVVSDEHHWRLTAKTDFPGDEVEVDLSAPGEDWDITDGSGAAAYRVVPGSPSTEYTLGVTSVAGVENEDEAGEEYDIASLRFDTETLAAEDGLYMGTHRSDEGTVVRADDFPPEC